MQDPTTNTTDVTVDAELLRDAVAELSVAAKLRILRKHQHRLNGMRSSETPGHRFWFPVHRAALRRVREVLGI